VVAPSTRTKHVATASKALGTAASGPTARLAAFRHIAAVCRKDVAIAAKRLDIVDTLEKLEAEAEALPDGIHHHFFLS
jgi:hypothetical protein